MNSSTIRTIPLSRITKGTWHKSDQVIPPVGLKVLCTNADKVVWFDWVDSDGKWKKMSIEMFAWQLPSLPIDIFWGLENDETN